MRRIRSLWPLLALSLSLAGCGEAPEAAPGLAEAPVLVLSQQPLPPELAELELYRVVALAAVPSEEGSPVVAIADAGNHRLLFWWPEVGRLEPFGRPGQGPGEFESIRSVWSMGDAFMVEDIRNNRRVFVHPERGELGMGPRTTPNLVGGGAFLPSGLLVEPADDTRADPFSFSRMETRAGRLSLEEADRPGWLPPLDSLELPLHPLYESTGLAFPPRMPISTDLTVPAGEHLLWLSQRTGNLVILPLGGEELEAGRGVPVTEEPSGASPPEPLVVPVPEAVIGDWVRQFAARQGPGPPEQVFSASLAARPDAEGRRVLFPLPRSTGQPLGWLIEARPGEPLVGRAVRLAENEELPYTMSAALALPDGRVLVGHEGGVVLLGPVEAR